MKNTVNERFAELIKLLGHSQNSFARSINVASTQIYNICGNRNAPSHKLYDAIGKQYLEANLRWLITGQGKPIIPNGLTESERNDLSQEVKELKEKIKHIEEQVAQLQPAKKKKSVSS